ncbi:hypothetical protein AB0B66_23265 [Catellatospora sp. NPDC049111]|uniref:hypothetical protein n=1 Tax=Catellatospora sp. NPDC049111 TaxID=3155271 RepID=UPI00340A3809
MRRLNFRLIRPGHRPLAACGMAALTFGMALVFAGTDLGGQPAKAWANAPVDILPASLGFTAAAFENHVCDPAFGGGPLSGQDVWVFKLPGDHAKTGDFVSVTATFSTPEGTEATAVVPTEGGGVVLRANTSKAWIAVPEGWTLTGAKAEITGTAPLFVLARTCPAEGTVLPPVAPDPSDSPTPDPSASADPDPSASPEPSASVDPGAAGPGPSASADPAPSGSASASPDPSGPPSDGPSASPSDGPSASPSVAPGPSGPPSAEAKPAKGTGLRVKALTPTAEPSTDPVEPPIVDPFTPPVDPITDPSAPPVEPIVDPSAGPVDPIVDPSAPPTDPIVDPSAGPVDPSAPPVDPIVDPSAGPVDPIVDPSAPPADPIVDPSAPPVEPSPEPEPPVGPGQRPRPAEPGPSFVSALIGLWDDIANAFR